MKTKLITGPMKSGKTRQLVLDLEQYVIAKKDVIWFEPEKDTRGGSHGNFLAARMEELKNSSYVHSFKIKKPEEIFTKASEVFKWHKIFAIFIDEFFMIPFERDFFYKYQSSELKEIPITFAGLISSWSCELFPAAKNIIPFMDEIQKTDAICMECSKPANYSYFIKNWDSKDSISIDTGDNYKCLCHDCYMKLTKRPFTIDPKTN